MKSLPPLKPETYQHVAAVLEHEAARVSDANPWDHRTHTHLMRAADYCRAQARELRATRAHQLHLT